MNVGQYVLLNEDKANRAIFGSPTSGGGMKGGVGEDASEEALLAEYDRLGGAITLGKDKVKMGSFYDFAGKKPHAKPKVILQFPINGKVQEYALGDALPLEVQAYKAMEAGEDFTEEDEGNRSSLLTSGRKAKGKKKVAEEDEE